MSEVVLEISNQDDLQLLLSFAKRLNVKILSIKGQNNFIETPIDPRIALLQQASKDPLFLSDLEEIAEDFSHIDLDIQ